MIPLKDIQEAKERLEGQLSQIAILSGAISAHGFPASFAGNLQRLESDVASLQDQLDAYFRGLPETLEIDQFHGEIK